MLLPLLPPPSLPLLVVPQPLPLPAADDDEDCLHQVLNRVCGSDDNGGGGDDDGGSDDDDDDGGGDDDAGGRWSASLQDTDAREPDDDLPVETESVEPAEFMEW
jgi:hypothetical protein